MSDINSLPEVQAAEADWKGLVVSGATQLKSVLDSFFKGAIAQTDKTFTDNRLAAEAIVIKEVTGINQEAGDVLKSFVGLGELSAQPVFAKLSDEAKAGLAVVNVKLDSYLG